MPTVLRIGPYRLFFFSNEGYEPPHVHVQREQSLAKFWLEPVQLASSTRFSAPEVRRLVRLVAEHRDQLLEAWHDHFGDH